MQNRRSLPTLALAALVVFSCRQGPAQAISSATRTASALTPLDAQGLVALRGQHLGQAVLMNVWSTWCAPCVEELPMLVALGDKYRDAGLRLTLISADPAELELEPAALGFLVELHAPFPSYVKRGSDDAFVAGFDPQWSGALPATVLLDGNGHVHRRWAGAVQEDELENALRELLSGRGTHNGARQ